MRQYQNYRHGDLISLSTAENVSMEAITDPQDLSTIGGRFKARRIELGLGQTDVAVAAGIKQSSYSAIETNDTKEITAKAARRSLDCSPYMAAIIQREQASNAASMATALQLLNQRPAMIQAPSFPSTTSCRSYRVGNDIRTDCN